MIEAFHSGSPRATGREVQAQFLDLSTVGGIKTAQLAAIFTARQDECQQSLCQPAPAGRDSVGADSEAGAPIRVNRGAQLWAKRAAMLHRLTGKFRLGYLGTELEWNSPPLPHRL